MPSNIVAVLMKREPGQYRVIGKIGDPKVLAWVDDPVIGVQNATGELQALFFNEREADSAADAIGRQVAGCGEGVDESPAAVLPGHLKQCPHGSLAVALALEGGQDHRHNYGKAAGY